MCGDHGGWRLIFPPPMQDHPRMCRDHFPVPSKLKDALGSPPHVRGPHYRDTIEIEIQGITPACAGTTLRWRWDTRDHWDHPRMCGDHSVSTGSANLSPGITPACAGTTKNILYSVKPFRDHPRMCGDHLTFPMLVIPVLGSPPHVRGPQPPCCLWGID